MKFLRNLLFGLSIVVFTACSSQVVYEGEKFVSEDGKFSIDFPVAPEISSQLVPTEAGDIDLHTFLYEESADLAFMATYNDFPEEFLKDKDPKEVLQNSKSGQLSAVGENVEVDIDEEITLGEYPGVHIKGNDGTVHIVAKDYLVGTRLYQLVLMSNGTYPEQAVIDGYLGSFELMK